MSYTSENRLVHVEIRAGLFRQQVCGFDNVILNHKIAMLCFEFADIFHQGVEMYESINNLDNDWRRLVFRGEETYSEQFENRIGRLYADWATHAERAVRVFDEIETEFVARKFDPSKAFELRRFVKEVRSMAIPDAEFFRQPALVELRDAAIDEFRGGATEPMGLCD